MKLKVNIYKCYLKVAFDFIWIFEKSVEGSNTDLWISHLLPNCNFTHFTYCSFLLHKQKVSSAVNEHIFKNF